MPRLLLRCQEGPGGAQGPAQAIPSPGAGQRHCRTQPRAVPRPPLPTHPLPGRGLQGRSWAAAGSTRPLRVLCEGARSQPSQKAREALGGITGPARPRCGPCASPPRAHRSAHPAPAGGGSAASQQLLATVTARHQQLCSCSQARLSREAVGQKAAPHPGCCRDTGQEDGAHRGAPPGWGIPVPASPLACTRRCPLSRPQGHSPALPSVRFLGSIRLW